MRKFIIIVNENNIEEILADNDVYDLLSEYVSYGEVRVYNFFNKSFDKIMQRVARPSRSMTLYRVLRITDAQLAKLQSNGLQLKMRKFSSWTKSLNSAKKIAVGKRKQEGHQVIIKQTFPPADIVIDVKNFYNTYGYYEQEEYFKYVRDENEVIVTHSAPLFINTTNTKLADAPKQVTPMLGDKMFLLGDSSPYEIDDVDSEQPHADKGLFYVSNDLLCITRMVHYIGPRKWEEIIGQS